MPSSSRSFGAIGGAVLASSNRQSMEIFLWRRWTQRVAAHDALALALGGWTLNAHHTFESTVGTLHRGDGERQSTQATSAVWQLVAGGGQGVPDGGLATSYSFAVNHLTAGPDGSLYAMDNQAGLVRRIGPDGRVSTVIGCTSGCTATGGGVGAPATATRFGTLGAHELGPDGSHYVSTNTHRVYRITPDGIVQHFAGNGLSPTVATHGEGGPATQASIGYVGFIKASPGGDVYFSTASNASADRRRIRRVDAEGIITTVVGDGTDVNGSSHPVPGTSVLQTDLYPNPVHLAVTPDGSLHIVFNSPNRVYKLVSLSGGFSTDEVLVPSQDGREAYVFLGGRHLRTLDALTGATLLTMGYDSAGRLITLTDANAQVTTIERQSDGRPTAIVAPGGQRTELTVSPEGLLTRVENPNEEAVALEYGTGGLLTKLTDPRNGVHVFEYDMARRRPCATAATSAWGRGRPSWWGKRRRCPRVFQRERGAVMTPAYIEWHDSNLDELRWLPDGSAQLDLSSLLVYVEKNKVQSQDDLEGWYAQAKVVYDKLMADASVTSGMSDFVWHYLSDADIRFKDPRYAQIQNERLTEFITELEGGA